MRSCAVAGGSKRWLWAPIISLPAPSPHRPPLHGAPLSHPPQAAELYGQTDPQSGEWVKGVFAAVWEKYNNRELPYTTWIVQDGPVDAIRIEGEQREGRQGAGLQPVSSAHGAVHIRPPTPPTPSLPTDLNTVLDDNKLLTLASGDRIPMTDNVKIMFENESLANASPATVSRAGIIYVSETDLDWKPVADAWVAQRPPEQQPLLRALFVKLVGENSATEMGHAFDFIARSCAPVMDTSRVGVVSGLFNLLGALLERYADALAGAGAGGFAAGVERLFVFSTAWSMGGLLEPEDRQRFDGYLRRLAPDALPAPTPDAETVYECVVDERSLQWRAWRAPAWQYPEGAKLDFSNLLVPTMDSTRAIFLLEVLHAQRRPVLLLGGPGTAKTSTAMMFFAGFDASKRLLKRVNFSSATTPGMLQDSIEGELDKRGGKSFGPPNGKRMTAFIDDVSMPAVNTWGDRAPDHRDERRLLSRQGAARRLQGL